MTRTARRIGRTALTIVVVGLAMIVCYYGGMFLRAAVDPSSTTDSTNGYVTVVHEDGTETWEKIGELCPAGTVEEGEIVNEVYEYVCK